VKFFWSEVAFSNAVDARAQGLVAYRMKSCADDELCLRHAVAAHIGGVDVDKIQPSSMLLKSMSRAIKAFAKAVERERAGV